MTAKSTAPAAKGPGGTLPVGTGLPDSLFNPPATKIEERMIELGDGSRHVFYFRHLPNSVFERYANWRASDDDEVIALAPSRLVARGVCDAEGKDLLSVELAERLKRVVLLRLTATVFEVNGYALKGDQKADVDDGGKRPNGSPAPDTATSGSGT